MDGWFDGCMDGCMDGWSSHRLYFKAPEHVKQTQPDVLGPVADKSLHLHRIMLCQCGQSEG